MITKLNYKQKENIIIIVTVFSLILVFSGLTYAFFTADNPFGSTASIIAQSGRMLINYDDGTDNILPITDIQPSNNIIVDKTFSLTGINTSANNGLNMPFSISLEYQNTFQEWELFYFLKRMDTNENVNVEIIDMYGEGQINEEILNYESYLNETLLGYYEGYINDWSNSTYTQEIAYGYFRPSSNEQTITFNLKMMFPYFEWNQDYNKGATFNGKIVVSGQKADTFATDSWETIANNINSGNASIYRVGSEKEVEIDGTNYTVRVANNSTSGECGNEDFSETACGFVVEFVDIIEERVMNNTSTNAGGWPATEMRAYANGEFFNKLPADLQSVITETKVISGYGDGDSSNFTSTDKIYLLSPHEIWEEGTEYDPYEYDTAWNNTRQLDYYRSRGVTTDNYSGAIKKYDDYSENWWLRTASFYYTEEFIRARYDGNLRDSYADNFQGFAPAFRIGELENLFVTDSWETIANNVIAGNTSMYKIGSQKEVEIDGTSYTVRLANNSTPDECNGEDFSETACGFVVEFVDIVGEFPMNILRTNLGGWPETAMRSYLNGEFFNKLPTNLQSIITNTTVISGYGIDDTNNFTSTDKIYLLSVHEVFELENDFPQGQETEIDTAWNNTRQLDYYRSKGITTDNMSGAIKKYNDSPTSWWLRSPYNGDGFFVISNIYGTPYSDDYYGLAPAFRIGETTGESIIVQRETAVDTVDKQLITQDNSLYSTDIFTDNTSDANVRFMNFNQSVYIEPSSNPNNNNYSIKLLERSNNLSSNKIKINGNLYHIIGIFNVKNADTGQYERMLKVAYNIAGSMSFDTNGTNNWGTSSLMQQLNTEDFINYMVGSTLKDKIANVEWDIGGLDSLNISLENAYKQERGLTPYTTNKNTWTGKIGLPSLTDYMFSYIDGNCANNLSTCPTSSGYSTPILTLTKDNTTTTNVYAYDDYENSLVTTTSGSLQPTFYLKKDVEFVHGDGTYYNPYIISWDELKNSDNGYNNEER